MSERAPREPPPVGKPHLHQREVDSTNERARALALAGAPHGTLVTAGHQTAGRGRQGRAWSAPAGRAVLASLVLRDLTRSQALLPLAAAVAVCEAAEHAAGPPLRCEIKWPNDVWIDRRKLAGILVEGRPQEGWAVLGIGLNVATPADEFPDEIREHATSLAIASKNRRPLTVAQVLQPLLDAIGHWLAAPAPEVLESWRQRDALRGHPVRWEGGEGVAAGIDDEGALLVETAEGILALDAGEVHLSQVAEEAR